MLAPYGAAVLGLALLGGYLGVWGRHYGLDLLVYRDSVSAWLSGADPYLRTFTASHLSFTYPPFALPALTPLAWGAFRAMQWVLSAVSVAAAALAVVLVLRDRGTPVTPRLWCGALGWACASALLLEPSRSAIDYGQIELVLMALVLVDLLVVPAPYRGLLTGLCAAVKLTPLVYVLFFAAERDLRSALRAGLSFAGGGTLAWLLWPGLSRQYWLHDLANPRRIGGITYAGNQSWYAVLHRAPFAGLPHLEAWWVAVALVMAAVGLLAARWCLRRGERGLAIVAVTLAGLLASPISWSHHWVWILLIPPLLTIRPRAAPSRPDRVLLWGLVALAVLAPYWWFGGGVPADLCTMVLPLWASAVLVAWSAPQARHELRLRADPGRRGAGRVPANEAMTAASRH